MSGDSSDHDGGLFEDYPVDQSSCKLLGPTALVRCARAHGIIVIASLVFKRHREKPKRPWRIWLFDVSKQIAGQMFVHGTNVLISDVGSQRTSSNACVYYFLNILLDTTFGVGIIYFILQFATWILAEKLLLKGFESGQYGSPPSFIYWLRQAAVYVFALTSMKLLVIAFFALWPGIFELGGWLLSFLGSNDTVQVIFVMGLFPILMNVLQFWLIDSIVKASAEPGAIGLDSDSPRLSYDPEEPLFHSTDSDSEDENESPSRLPDLEAQRRPVVARSRSRSQSRSSDLSYTVPLKMNRRPSNEVERRHTASPSGTHAYPPSIPGSPASSRPQSTSPGPGSGGLSGSRKRRSPPPALLPRSPMQKAINAAEGLNSASLVGSAAMIVAPPPVGAKEDVEEWNAWDDDGVEEEDWAGRVGEEEWTGRRIEATKGEVDGVWKES